MTRLFATLAACLCLAAPAMASAQTLRPVYLSRFAMFLDLGSVERDGDLARLRYLMMLEAAPAQEDSFWGGWVGMALDCRARTADQTGFTSIRTGGREGPPTADTQPGWPIAPGSVEAALAAAACDGLRPLDRPDASDVEEAVRLGRQWLADTP